MAAPKTCHVVQLVDLGDPKVLHASIQPEWFTETILDQ